MQTELKKLEKKLGELSVSQLATALNYRSPNTINSWFKKGKIPPTAIKRVREYLKGEVHA